MKARIQIILSFFICCLFASAASAQFSTYLEGASQPQLAKAGDRAYLVYVSEGTIKLAVLAGTDETALAIPVAAPQKLMSGMRRGPRIAASGESVVVTAIAGKPAQLMEWRSTDAGKTWAQVTESIAGEPGAVREGLHDLAAGPDGKLAVVWLDLRNVARNGTELWMAESDDAGATWGAPRVIYSNPGGTVCECCHPSVAYDTQGEPVVLFRNALDGNRDMYLWRQATGKAEKLGTGTWPLQGCPMAGGDVAVFVNPMQDEEEVATVWRREGTIYTAGPGSEEGVVANGRQPVIAVRDTGWPTVFYTNADGLFAFVPLSGTYHIEKERAAYPVAVATSDAVVVAYESGGGVELYGITDFERYEKVER